MLNVSTDLYIMSIPIPILLRTSFSTPKKLGLVLLFSGGIFVSVAGVLRCVEILNVRFLSLSLLQQIQFADNPRTEPTAPSTLRRGQSERPLSRS
jgi:hypothetical protein